MGTNALHVSPHSKPVPLLEVVSDYKNLVKELRTLFPSARIGLMNVIPRSVSSLETVIRIKHFNTLFSYHVYELCSNITWINLFWEFIDNFGFLKEELYGAKGLHLSRIGKKLM